MKEQLRLVFGLWLKGQTAAAAAAAAAAATAAAAAAVFRQATSIHKVSYPSSSSLWDTSMDEAAITFSAE